MTTEVRKKRKAGCAWLEEDVSVLPIDDWRDAETAGEMALQTGQRTYRGTFTFDLVATVRTIRVSARCCRAVKGGHLEASAQPRLHQIKAERVCGDYKYGETQTEWME